MTLTWSWGEHFLQISLTLLTGSEPGHIYNFGAWLGFPDLRASCSLRLSHFWKTQVPHLIAIPELAFAGNFSAGKVSTIIRLPLLFLSSFLKGAGVKRKWYIAVEHISTWVFPDCLSNLKILSPDHLFVPFFSSSLTFIISDKKNPSITSRIFRLTFSLSGTNIN